MYRKFLRFLLTIVSRWENKLWRKLYVCNLKKPKEKNSNGRKKAKVIDNKYKIIAFILITVLMAHQVFS
jgi:hypothetical protein